MMDDDEGSSSGMSFASGYLLGQMTAEDSHRIAEFKESVRQRFARPQRTPYNADAVDQAIASWKQAVQDRDTTIGRLERLNFALESELAQARTTIAEQRSKEDLLFEGIERDRAEVYQLETQLLAAQNQITRLEEELAQLRGGKS